MQRATGMARAAHTIVALLLGATAPGCDDEFDQGVWVEAGPPVRYHWDVPVDVGELSLSRCEGGCTDSGCKDPVNIWRVDALPGTCLSSPIEHGTLPESAENAPTPALVASEHYFVQVLRRDGCQGFSVSYAGACFTGIEFSP